MWVTFRKSARICGSVLSLLLFFTRDLFYEARPTETCTAAPLANPLLLANYSNNKPGT